MDIIYDLRWRVSAVLLYLRLQLVADATVWFFVHEEVAVRGPVGVGEAADVRRVLELTEIVGGLEVELLLVLAELGLLHAGQSVDLGLEPCLIVGFVCVPQLAPQGVPVRPRLDKLQDPKLLFDVIAGDIDEVGPAIVLYFLAERPPRAPHGRRAAIDAALCPVQRYAFAKTFVAFAL